MVWCRAVQNPICGLTVTNKKTVTACQGYFSVKKPQVWSYENNRHNGIKEENNQKLSHSLGQNRNGPIHNFLYSNL